MDLRLPIAFIGAGIVFVSMRALFRAHSAGATVGREIVIGLTLALGLITAVTAPVLAALVTYTTGGQFDFRWWW